MAPHLVWLLLCTVPLNVFAEEGDDLPPGMVAPDSATLAEAEALKKLREEKVPFINQLISQVKNGNSDMLQEAIVSVKVALGYKMVSLAKVTAGEDLIPVIIMGLKSDDVRIKRNSCWIISEILANGEEAHREKLVVGDGEAIYPILLGMLNSEDDSVWQIALYTLVWMFDKEGTRDQFRNPAIIPAITNLAQKTEDMDQLGNVGKVASFFSHGPDPEKSYPLSLDTVQKVASLFEILYKKTKDDQITAAITESLIYLTRVEGSETAIVSGGVLPGLVDLLSHPIKEVRSAALIILAKAAGRGRQMLEFFKALNGTEGIENFCKIVQNSEGVHPELGISAADVKALSQFLVMLNDALAKGDAPLKAGLSDALIDSGFVVPLIECLKEDETPEPFPLLAVTVLTKLTKEIAPHRLGPVIAAGAVPSLVDLLDSSNKLVRWLAVSGLGEGNVFKTGPEARDQMIRHGGIDKLIRLLEGEGRNYVITVGTLHILDCFEDLLATQPRVAVENFEKMADSLKGLMRPVMVAWYLENLKDMGDHYGKMLVRVFRCVGHLVAFGKDGEELVERKELLDEIIELIPYKHREAQRIAMETLNAICEVDQKYVAILIRKGILTHHQLVQYFKGEKTASSFDVFIMYLLDGIQLTPTQLEDLTENKLSELGDAFRATKGSWDPKDVFQAKIYQIFYPTGWAEILLGMAVLLVILVLSYMYYAKYIRNETHWSRAMRRGRRRR